MAGISIYFNAASSVNGRTGAINGAGGIGAICVSALLAPVHAYRQQHEMRVGGHWISHSGGTCREIREFPGLGMEKFSSIWIA